MNKHTASTPATHLTWFLLAGLIFFLNPTQATTKGKPTTHIISHIDQAKQSLTVGGKTYIIGDRAKVTIDGDPASFSDLITGMKVQISSRVISYGKKKNSNIHEAKRIRARHTKQSKKQQK